MCECTIQFLSKTVNIKQLFWILLPIIPHTSKVLLVSIATKLWRLDRIAADTSMWES